jgi:hypothetical protein
MYMEPAVLTRTAKAETPLQESIICNVANTELKYGAEKSSRLAPPGRLNANKKRNPSRKRDPFFNSTLGQGLALVPVLQETVSQAESEKFLYVSFTLYSTLWVVSLTFRPWSSLTPRHEPARQNFPFPAQH